MLLPSYTPLLRPSSSNRSRSRYEPAKHELQQENHRAPKRPVQQPWLSENPPEREPRPPRTPRSKRRPDQRKPEHRLDPDQLLVENRKGHAASLAHRACSSNNGHARKACKLRSPPCNAF